MTIGQNIKKYRKEAGLTQEALAGKLLLTPSAISQWETDRVMPDISQLPSDTESARKIGKSFIIRLFYHEK